jgi:uncharacterized OB-fold protein
MKGSRCRCGFATVSGKKVCPRCGKVMKPAEWPDEGKVLSFTRLQAVPEGLSDPYNLALVAVEDGPKLVCWTSGTLEENDDVQIVEVNGKHLCAPKTDLTFRLDSLVSKPD